jgi:cytochrome c-type biogenesis protein CcmH
MTAFLVLCAMMVLCAIAVLAWPLLRPLAPVAKGAPVVPPAAPLAFAVAVFVAITAAAIYARVSTFPWNDPSAAQPTRPGHGSPDDVTSIEAAVTRLQAHLVQDPDDSKGWRVLGRSYVMMGQSDRAVEAYERAVRTSKVKDPALELDLAEALVLADNESQRARAQSILDATLAIDANNAKALWYRGVIAMRAGDHATAREDWSKLLEQNPPPEVRDVIVEQLASIGVVTPGNGRPQIGGGSASVTPRGRTIQVHVTVDPALAGRLKPGVPLFVSARQPGIPGPPLAAVRLTADQLPTHVTLSDANAMIEGRDLSSVGEIEVVARVAFSGSVMSSTGDLVGSAVLPKGRADPLEIVIARVQP